MALKKWEKEKNYIYIYIFELLNFYKKNYLLTLMCCYVY